ncbi:MAG: FAD-binding protein [Coriobacteriales bacterium]
MRAEFDVIVVGSGIAGCVAASCAAEERPGSRVLLASSGPVFSGSSFFRGTWGLGLIAPADDEDAPDLAATIAQVGCQQVDAQLVESFVAGIEPAVQRLEGWGVRLRRAAQGADAQREYIPCFDHKHRSWRGLECASFKEVLGVRLREQGVEQRGSVELLDILKDEDGAVCGAVFWDEEQGRFLPLACRGLVLAGGGAASLFSRRLSSGDCRATTQALAANAGARLVNMEFMQFMPGMVRPRSGLVFNEKTFKYMRLPQELVERLGGEQEARRLLEQRSGYGPFTSRLESRAVDLAIEQAGPQGLRLVPEFPPQLPDFVQVYNSWLSRDLGLDPCAPLSIALYAHASNGGIAIDSGAWTGVPGLYAAGECTGGMHGADRLGGLSTANCLVFGMQAGQAAARWAAEGSSPASVRSLPAWTAVASPAALPAEEGMRAVMDEHCMTLRSVAGLEQAATALERCARELAGRLALSSNPRDAALTRRTALRLQTAAALVEAARKRPCSCGSHCIADSAL